MVSIKSDGTVSFSLPTSFTLVSASTPPSTGIQPVPAWMTFRDSIVETDLHGPFILPSENTEYAKQVRTTSVTDSGSSGYQSQHQAQREQWWQSIVSECKLVASPELEERLQSIVETVLDPLFASLSPNSSSSAEFILPSYLAFWILSRRRWNVERELQGHLYDSSIALANAFLKLRAAEQGQDNILHIIIETEAKQKYTKLSQEFKANADFYIVTGE